MSDLEDTQALTRRDVLVAGAASAAALAVGAKTAYAAPKAKRPSRTPAAYVSHGSPMLAVHKQRGAEFTRWTQSFGKPVAVLMVSAHFERAPITLGATTRTPLVYDFYGFPKSLYQVKYPSPGAPKLARRVRQLLKPKHEVRLDPKRGHDHGAWVPMKWMYPKADVPLLSLSLVAHNPETLFRIGRALRPLRDEGVMIVGSGALTHNLRNRAGFQKTLSWASDFDAWATRVLSSGNKDALLDWKKKAPAPKTNHPTAEHFVPLILAAGARHDTDKATYPITGFDASMSRRCVMFA